MISHCWKFLIFILLWIQLILQCFTLLFKYSTIQNKLRLRLIVVCIAEARCSTDWLYDVISVCVGESRCSTDWLYDVISVCVGETRCSTDWLDDVISVCVGETRCCTVTMWTSQDDGRGVAEWSQTSSVLPAVQHQLSISRLETDRRW